MGETFVQNKGRLVSKQALSCRLICRLLANIAWGWNLLNWFQPLEANWAQKQAIPNVFFWDPFRKIQPMEVIRIHTSIHVYIPAYRDVLSRWRCEFLCIGHSHNCMADLSQHVILEWILVFQFLFTVVWALWCFSNCYCEFNKINILHYLPCSKKYTMCHNCKDSN